MNPKCFSQCKEGQKGGMADRKGGVDLEWS